MMLTTSQEIAALAEALAKAQGAFPQVTKDKTAQIQSAKGAYAYSYADLASILEAVRKPLSANGLAIIQPVIGGEENPVLVTRLMHASGQWIESTYPLTMYERPQETGSAITYARRYALTSLLGIAAEEDDDGAAAQGGTRQAQQPSRSAPAQRAPQDGATSDKGQCPKCGKWVRPSQYPKPGRTHYCGGCKVSFEPPPADPEDAPWDPPDPMDDQGQ